MRCLVRALDTAEDPIGTRSCGFRVELRRDRHPRWELQEGPLRAGRAPGSAGLLPALHAHSGFPPSSTSTADSRKRVIKGN